MKGTLNYAVRPVITKKRIFESGAPRAKPGEREAVVRLWQRTDLDRNAIAVMMRRPYRTVYTWTHDIPRDGWIIGL